MGLPARASGYGFALAGPVAELSRLDPARRALVAEAWKQQRRMIANSCA
jgi:hypothetical protein